VVSLDKLSSFILLLESFPFHICGIVWVNVFNSLKFYILHYFGSLAREENFFMDNVSLLFVEKLIYVLFCQNAVFQPRKMRTWLLENYVLDFQGRIYRFQGLKLTLTNRLNMKSLVWLRPTVENPNIALNLYLNSDSYYYCCCFRIK